MGKIQGGFMNIKVFLKGLCDLYNYTLTDEQLMIYIGLLNERGEINWKALFKAIATNEKGFPTMNTIFKYLDGQLDVVDRAQGRVGKIFKAIARYGYYSQQEAYESGAIDDIDWEIILQSGGWKSLCHSEEGDTTLRAQMRMTAMALIKTEEKSSRKGFVLLEGGVSSQLDFYR